MAAANASSMSAGNHVEGQNAHEGPAGELVPEHVQAALPSDPFEQLDLARRIASMAHRSYVANLQGKLGSSQDVVNALQARVGELEASLKDTTDKLTASQEEQAKLASDKTALVATVKKLNRDVAKLEAFKCTLMQQLQEEPDEEAAAVASTPSYDDGNADSSQQTSEREASSEPQFMSGLVTAKPAVAASTADDESEKTVGGGAYIVEDDGASAMAATSSAPLPGPQHSTSMPRSSGTIRIVDSSASSSMDQHHRGSSGSFGRSLSGPERSDDKMEAFSMPAAMRPQRTPLRTPSLTPQFSPHITPLHTPPTGSATSSPRRREGRPRVDGKEFFRQARNRLSYEQFSSFLANIKELNAHRQTREETLRKADDIFGPDNKDLYKSFDGLLSRHLPP